MVNEINDLNREEVLEAFAVELSHDRETLERYLRDFPSYANELVDLSCELAKIYINYEMPLSIQELETIEAALQTHVPIEKDPLADVPVTTLREIAVQLKVPRQVITAFRERRVVINSVPEKFLTSMAVALNCTVDLLVKALNLPPGYALARSYKADGKPSVETSITFERLLIDAGVSEENRAALLKDNS